MFHMKKIMNDMLEIITNIMMIIINLKYMTAVLIEVLHNTKQTLRKSAL